MHKITKITEKDGVTPKVSAVHQVGREIHFVHEPTAGVSALMAHVPDDGLMTRTSTVEEVSVHGNVTVITTRNTIYTLEYIEPQEYQMFNKDASGGRAV